MWGIIIFKHYHKQKTWTTSVVLYLEYSPKVWYIIGFAPWLGHIKELNIDIFSFSLQDQGARGKTNRLAWIQDIVSEWSNMTTVSFSEPIMVTDWYGDQELYLYFIQQFKPL